MNLRELEYLVAVADHGHFGRAAAACYVSQPTLSTQLRKLEQELGVQLVERGPRGNLLTPIGNDVVAHARVVLDEVTTIRGLATRARNPRSGRLRLGIFPTLAPYLLPHVMPAVREALPELQLQLVEEKTAELLADLTDGKLDAVVVAAPLADPALSTLPLFREEFVLAGPAGHPMVSAEGELPVEALAGTDLLLLEEGHCLRTQALELCDAVAAEETRGFRATSLETLRHMVATGAGVTLLPYLAVLPPVPGNDAIGLRRFAAPAPARDILLAWRTSTGAEEVMGELAEALRAAPVDGE